MLRCTYAPPGRQVNQLVAHSGGALNQELWATRRGFVGGNWKCNGSVEKTKEIVDNLNNAHLPFNEVDVRAPKEDQHFSSCLSPSLSSVDA